MTQDEIIEMWNSVIKYAPSEVRIAEFAKMVAAKATAVEREALAQPEQEPVADDFFRMIADKNPKPFPLPQRTWVGLTDDEIMQIWGGIIKYAPSEVRIKYFARAIESKLKEVNA